MLGGWWVFAGSSGAMERDQCEQRLYMIHVPNDQYMRGWLELELLFSVLYETQLWRILMAAFYMLYVTVQTWTMLMHFSFHTVAVLKWIRRQIFCFDFVLPSAAVCLNTVQIFTVSLPRRWALHLFVCRSLLNVVIQAHGPWDKIWDVSILLQSCLCQTVPGLFDMSPAGMQLTSSPESAIWLNLGCNIGKIKVQLNNF